ncbi:predicted protein [Clavispora lusitaniae ATCC 42720]|uniref:Uncharacterized protein n=1 Tax=Clavispora lusitaniae (strain ATCC 42720) TaxID=306902 RepID=C4Y7T8_CLAL4|nr:uncharacterized protein CLUG_04266 [Clavispora lusitaniae ATCC 42720]EEQ40139.1 predicted protein [Clavispora lusitaniae ATCC 42720]
MSSRVENRSFFFTHKNNIWIVTHQVHKSFSAYFATFGGLESSRRNWLFTQVYLSRYSGFGITFSSDETEIVCPRKSQEQKEAKEMHLPYWLLSFFSHFFLFIYFDGMFSVCHTETIPSGSKKKCKHSSEIERYLLLLSRIFNFLRIGGGLTGIFKYPVLVYHHYYCFIKSDIV